jgi:hypothetical protein
MGRGGILRPLSNGRKLVAPRLPPIGLRTRTLQRGRSMGNRKRREPGPQHHAEGEHGEKTHRALIGQLQHAQAPRDEPPATSRSGERRLHEDRDQHDDAEKESEKVEAQREVNQRGNVDDNVLKHARIPHEGDSV